MVWLSDEVMGYVIALKNRSWVEETSAGSGLFVSSSARLVRSKWNFNPLSESCSVLVCLASSRSCPWVT